MDDLDHKSTPWLNGGFDIEGVVAAFAVFLGALLLGWLWGPLFWLGFVAFVAVLLATRWAGRTPPAMASAIVAPCDGIVVSVTRMEAPPELRMNDASVTRVRISSAPTSTNKVYTPISGSLEHVAIEAGDSSILIAMRPDDEGMARAWLCFESQGQQVGIRLASGGFGPRIDIDMTGGDIARLGKPCGSRRLGGWCDLYIPVGAGQLIWPGQTLVGGETVIGRLRSDTDEAEDVFELQREAAEAVAEEDPFEPVIEEEEESDDQYLSPEETNISEEDPAILFARLREAARRSEEGE
jgi:phosphatidylserine decarboxylase